MRTDTIRAAAVQIAPDLSGRAGTIERVLNAIAEAADKGAQFIVFPETFVPYYPYFSFILPPVQQGAPHMDLIAEAVVVPSPETQAVADAAAKRGVVVVLGVNERDHGSLYNTQLIFDADGTRSRPPTTNAWCGAWATVRGSRSWIPPSAASARSPVGSITTRSPATP